MHTHVYGKCYEFSSISFLFYSIAYIKILETFSHALKSIKITPYVLVSKNSAYKIVDTEKYNNLLYPFSINGCIAIGCIVQLNVHFMFRKHFEAPLFKSHVVKRKSRIHPLPNVSSNLPAECVFSEPDRRLVCRIWTCMSGRGRSWPAKSLASPGPGGWQTIDPNRTDTTSACRSTVCTQTHCHFLRQKMVNVWGNAH